MRRSEDGWPSASTPSRAVADYAADHDPDREAAWIAEVNGRRAGCRDQMARIARTWIIVAEADPEESRMLTDLYCKEAQQVDPDAQIVVSHGHTMSRAGLLTREGGDDSHGGPNPADGAGRTQNLARHWGSRWPSTSSTQS